MSDSAEAWATFRKLVARWQLTDEQAAGLLGVSEEDLARPDGTGLGEEALARIAHLAGIARALNSLYSHHLTDGWMLRPMAGPPFAGQWPLDALSEGGLPAFAALRAELEARL